MDQQRYRIGFDIGGTFTDFVLADAATGAIRLHKCLTTPKDPSVGALEGIDALCVAEGIGLDLVGQIVHGTTLVTNAIIERKGAKVALLTTAGFRDIVEMGNEQRYDIYDLFLKYPDPLVDRRFRVEIDERVSRDGAVLRPIDVAAVRRAVAELDEAGVDAIAVCFLHAYKNPAHEQAVRDLITAEFPALAVSLSSEVVPELREYERATTTIGNAFVQPLVARYLGRLQGALASRGFAGQFYLMQSSGGLASASTAARFPIRLLESGPAGGGIATGYFAEQAGHRDVISFDMGGTTAKACLVRDGKPDIAPMMEAARVHRFKRGSGLPIKAPVIDMIEIGAGGGSIARVDELGLLKVGPHSAGADPGPACYGRGGLDPTVTDANLLLGYLNPDFFLGGRLKLDKPAAEAAVARIAAPLGLDVEQAAWGIYSIVSESMASAARVHIVEKGCDPREHALVALGGAGPAHAARVARILGVRSVIVPQATGAASALGFLVAPVSFEFATSLPGVLEDLDLTAVNDLLASLEAKGRDQLTEAGIAPRDVTVTRVAEMRLLGQLHEISVPLPSGAISAADLPDIAARFGARYAELYSHYAPGTPAQAINWRVLCSGPTPEAHFVRSDMPAAEHAALTGHRSVLFADAGGRVEAAVYDRYALRPGDKIVGPALVEEREATTVIPPGDQAEVDAALNLVIAIGSSIVRQMAPAGASLAERRAAIERDPIGLEMMWSRLINVVEECWITVYRTAFSLIISEAQDFACEILDPQCNSLAHSPRSMPVFNLTLPKAVKAMLARYPAETLQPGDVLITNDPWLCAGHLFDVAIVTPVFREAKLVGLIGTIGHVSDIGGTKDSLRAREIYEEGVQIPPMKLYKAGVPNEDLLTLLAENVRKSEQVLGDINAMVSANAGGAERLLQFMADYGMDDLEALAHVVQDRSEAAIRSAIAKIPDGTYRSEITTSGVGTPLRFPVAVTVAGDSIEVDWAGAPDQLPQGGINSTFNYTAAHTTYPLKCLLSPGVPSNAGCFRPFTVKAPLGSILNCEKPVAVNLRTRTGWYIAPNLFLALAQALPDRVQSFTGLPASMTFYGTDPNGRVFNDHLMMGGGQGASDGADGRSSLLFPTSAGNTSIELFETRAPVVVLEKRFLADSGGAGRHRGGLGQLLRVKKLLDDGRPVLSGVYPEGVNTEVPGLTGGSGGGKPHAQVRDGDLVEDCGLGGLIALDDAKTIIEVELAGGAGFGNPAERSVDAVEADLLGGYITPGAAEGIYRCRVGADGRIDRAATRVLRAGGDALAK